MAKYLTGKDLYSAKICCYMDPIRMWILTGYLIQEMITNLLYS